MQLAEEASFPVHFSVTTNCKLNMVDDLQKQALKNKMHLRHLIFCSFELTMWWIIGPHQFINKILQWNVLARMQLLFSFKMTFLVDSLTFSQRMSKLQYINYINITNFRTVFYTNMTHNILTFETGMWYFQQNHKADYLALHIPHAPVRKHLFENIHLMIDTFIAAAWVLHVCSTQSWIDVTMSIQRMKNSCHSGC